MEFDWLVKQSGKIKAGFCNEMDAREYASMMMAVNRAAGYRDKYEVVEVEREGERDR